MTTGLLSRTQFTSDVVVNGTLVPREIYDRLKALFPPGHGFTERQIAIMYSGAAKGRDFTPEVKSRLRDDLGMDNREIEQLKEELEAAYWATSA